MFISALKHSALKTLDNTRYGTIRLTFPDGSMYHRSGTEPGPAAELTLHDWRALRMIAFHGDIGFADAYRSGLCDTPDLEALVTFTLLNEAATSSYVHGTFISRLTAMLQNLTRLNTLGGSRKNIHAHYDLGNDFYKLWLDPSMTYSSALFNDKEGITDAQHAKYDRILDKFEKQSGSVLEIGCGWGGFAERALQRGDFGVKGITLSHEQKLYADQRLGGNAAIALEDYRHQEGKYDFLVSIEMFEAVGERYWKTYFGKIKQLMREGGRTLVQTITIDHAYFARYRMAGDFIRSYIFPGGMLPSPERFTEEAAHAGLKVVDRFAFGEDYARTLRYWLGNFDEKLHDVKALGFDEPFVRLWRLYLAACAASFSVGRTSVMQMELRHA